MVTKKKKEISENKAEKGKKKVIRVIKKNVKILKQDSENVKSEFKGAFGDSREVEWASEEQEAAVVGLETKKRADLESVTRESFSNENTSREVVDGFSPREDESKGKNYNSGGGSQIDYAKGSGGGDSYTRNSDDSQSNRGYQSGGSGSSGDMDRGYDSSEDRNYATSIEPKKDEKKDKDRFKHPWEI